MIKGAPYWDVRDNYYVQTNNAVERTLARYEAKTSLVACGPSAAVNCLASMGAELSTLTPAGWTPQPEDVLTLWFHDPRNYAAMANVRKGTDPAITKFSPHEVPQYYPLALREVFGVHARFTWDVNFFAITQHVEAGNAAMIALKKPGHYLAVVAYDADEMELIYHDSWPGRFPDNNGFAQRLTAGEYNSNVQPYAVLIEEVRE